MEQISDVVTNVIDSSTCINVEATNGISNGTPFPPASDNDMSAFTYIIHLPTALEEELSESSGNFVPCPQEEGGTGTGEPQIPVELKHISDDITSFTELTNLDDGKISKVNGISTSGAGHSSSAPALEPTIVENGNGKCTIANVLFATQVPSTTTNDLTTCQLQTVTEDQRQNCEVKVDVNGDGECVPLLLELCEDKCESGVVKQGKMKEEPRSIVKMDSTSGKRKMKAETTAKADCTSTITKGPVKTYVRKKAVPEESTPTLPPPPPAPPQRSKKPAAAKSPVVVPRKPVYSRGSPGAATPTRVVVVAKSGGKRDSVSPAATSSTSSTRKRKLVVDAQKQINNVEFKKQLLETEDIVQEPMADLAPTTKVAKKYLESGGVAQFFTSPGRVIRNVPLSKLYQTKLVTAMESYSTSQTNTRTNSQIAVLDSSCLKILEEEGCSPNKSDSSNELCGEDGPSPSSKQRQQRTPKLTTGSLEAAFKQYTYHKPLVFKECESIRLKSSSKSAKRLSSQLEKRISCKNNIRKAQAHSSVSVIKVEICGDEEPPGSAVWVKESSEEQHSQVTPPTQNMKSEEAVPVPVKVNKAQGEEVQDREMINVCRIQVKSEGKVADGTAGQTGGSCEFVLP